MTELFDSKSVEQGSSSEFPSGEHLGKLCASSLCVFTQLSTFAGLHISDPRLSQIAGHRQEVVLSAKPKVNAMCLRGSPFQPVLTTSRETCKKVTAV